MGPKRGSCREPRAGDICRAIAQGVEPNKSTAGRASGFGQGITNLSEGEVPAKNPVFEYHANGI